MGEYLKELTEDLPKFIQESEVDETALPELENATVVQVSKEDKEEREGADEKSDLILQKILLDLVSETVDQDMGVEAQNRLQEELDGMEFEAAHNMVKKEVLYKNTFTETEKSWLSAYEASARKVEKRLRTRLLPILENQKERTERRMYLGKKLDMRAIADPGGAVYKRTFPGKKTDAVVCVLVDNSGSMIGHRIEAAKVAALTLYDFAGKPESPFWFTGTIRMVTIIVIQVRKPFIFTVMQSSRKTETTVCGSSLWKTMAVTGTGQPFYLWQISF